MYYITRLSETLGRFVLLREKIPESASALYKFTRLVYYEAVFCLLKTKTRC